MLTITQVAAQIITLIPNILGETKYFLIFSSQGISLSDIFIVC